MRQMYDIGCRLCETMGKTDNVARGEDAGTRYMASASTILIPYIEGK
jgi:hypothetical protein